MTVAHPRSRVAHGDGPLPAPLAAGRASAASLRPQRPPPPPAALPRGFTPAFLGFAAPPCGPGAGSGSDAEIHRCAGSGSDAEIHRPLSPPPARGRSSTRLQSVISGTLDLDTPSPTDYAAINLALAAWRTAGCPPSSTLKAPTGILHPSSTLNGFARPRARKAVRFSIPSPRIQGAPSSPAARLHEPSHRPSPSTPAATSARPATPVADEGWTLVLSRHDLRAARAAACPKPSMRRSLAPILPLRQVKKKPPSPHRSISRSSPLKKRRCHRCQARDHLRIDCRDPLRCALCWRWGHGARDCRPPPAPSPPPRAAPSPPSRTASRPSEASCVIATSYDLDTARLEWEHTAISVYVLNPPPGTDRSDIDDAFRIKFNLRSSDLLVSAHHPEPYLIKFSSAELRDRVLRTKRAAFKYYGMDIHFRPWRAVSLAYNADLHYRVHLHVDGLPPFAWWPEIVDQVLGRSCAVQRLDDGFTTMEVTSSFGLWAWTAEPHHIPKVLWCTFANRAPGGLSSLVRVSEDRPDQWKRGITFRVLLHVEIREDYSDAPPLDGGAPISDFRPSKHTLPQWRVGVVDGSTASHAAAATIPPLGELRRDAEPESSRGNRSRSRGAPVMNKEPRARERDSDPNFRPIIGREHRRPGRQDKERESSRERRDRQRSRSRHGQRCDDREPSHHRRDDDGDDENRYKDRREPSRRAASKAPSARSQSRHDARGDHGQDRNSRYSYGQGSRRHATSSLPSLALGKPLPSLPATPATFAVAEPGLTDAQVTEKLQDLFRVGTANMREALPVILGLEPPPPPPPSFASVCRDWTAAIRAAPAELAIGFSRLASPPAVSFALPISAAADDRVVPETWEEGTEAWSDQEEVPHVAVDHVVGAAVSPPRLASSTDEETQQGLVWGSGLPPPSVCEHGRSGAAPALQPASSDALHSVELDKDAVRCHDIAVPDKKEELVRCSAVVTPMPENSPGNDIDGVVQPASLADIVDLVEAQDNAEDLPLLGPVRNLFGRPSVPLLPRPAPPAPAAAPPTPVRRSARLEDKPQMNTVDRAVWVLNTKMGIVTPAEAPLVTARKQYLDCYKNQLPGIPIQGLSRLFKLKMPLMTRAHEALVELAGAGGAEFVHDAAQEIVV